jgi:hypothetical protein
MTLMELRPIPIASYAASERRHARARSLVQVKFVAMPMALPCEAFAQGTGAHPKWATLLSFLSRVIGRLVAARP